MHQNARLTPAGRALLVRRVLEEGQAPAEVGRALGVSRRTVYKWIGVAGEEDPAAEEAAVDGEEDRAPSIVAALDGELVVETSGHGPAAGPGAEEKLGRIGCLGHRIHGDRRRASRGVGWEFLHVCVDDATRVSYNEILSDERAVTVTAFTERAVAWFAALGVRVERVMTDNGSGDVSHRFADSLDGLGIRHIRTRPHRPQTNGNAERFIQTALRVGIPEAVSQLRPAHGRPLVLPEALQ